jgi:cell division septation protein DedD
MVEERTANEGTHWLPDQASIVALVRQRDGGAWAAGVAIGLADIVGRRRGRTFLANTVPGPAELDGLMEAENQPGLTRALAGELAVSEIARSAPQRSFAYLPAGSPSLNLSQLLAIPAFGDLLRRVAERGGTLLLYVAQEELDALPADPENDLPVDGCIAIGDIDDLALTVGAPLLARVERPPGDRTPEAGAAADVTPEALEDSAGFEDADVPEPAKARRVPAWAPWAGVAAGLLLAWFAWGTVSEPAGDGAGVPADAARQVEAEPDGVAPDADAQAMLGGRAAAEGTGATVMEAPEEAAPEEETAFAGTELPYSVLVASFARLEDADRHLGSLDSDDTLFIVAPTPIRDRVYYRILAGAREDRAAATTLMRELVAAGEKEEVKDWDVRPVRFAWLIGTFSDRRAADRRIAELGEEGIHAYRLAELGDSPGAWRVYSGAWESEQAAEEVGRSLRDLGESAVLVTRRGRSR